ncbi:hypothetical protein [Sinobacterium caligoides]|nr:hypothetical protein [Sinobacterium caligoides]
MLWTSLILTVLMILLIRSTPHDLSTFRLRCIVGGSAIGYGLSSIAMHQQGTVQNIALAGQMISLVLFWLIAAKLHYHSLHFILFSTITALMTATSISYISFAQQFLDMPEELAIAMGLGSSTLFSAILLLLITQQQDEPTDPVNEPTQVS